MAIGASLILTDLSVVIIDLSGITLRRAEVQETVHAWWKKQDGMRVRNSFLIATRKRCQSYEYDPRLLLTITVVERQQLR